MAELGPELSQRIIDIFQKKYDRAKLYGSPISDTLKALKNGTATFRDAGLYAGEVGSMLSDAMKEVLKLETLPDQKLYYELAKQVIEPSLQKSYGLITDTARAIQDDINNAIGVGLKAVAPEFNYYKSNEVIQAAASATTQSSLDNALTNRVTNFAQTVVDDTQKINADIQSRSGLEVKVTRIYDRIGLRRGTKYRESCQWCLDRCGKDVPYREALAKGMFERHPGCSCEIEYTSKKGVKTVATSATGWKEDRNKRIDQAKKMLDESQKSSYNNSPAKNFLQTRLDFVRNGEKTFIPNGAQFERQVIIAGTGTENPIKDINRLVATYNKPASEWRKMSGIVESDRFTFDVHWYEANDKIQREPKLKAAVPKGKEL